VQYAAWEGAARQNVEGELCRLRKEQAALAAAEAEGVATG